MTVTEMLLAGILVALGVLCMGMLNAVRALITLVEYSIRIHTRLEFLPQHQVKVERALDTLVKED